MVRRIVQQQRGEKNLGIPSAFRREESVEVGFVEIGNLKMGNFRLYTLSSLEYVSFEERRGYLFFIFWDGDVLNDI